MSSVYSLFYPNIMAKDKKVGNRFFSLLLIFFLILFLAYLPDLPEPSLSIRWLIISVGGLVMALMSFLYWEKFHYVWFGIIGWLLIQAILLPDVLNPVESRAVLVKYAGVSMFGFILASIFSQKDFYLPSMGKIFSFVMAILVISCLYQLIPYAADGTFFENLYKIQGLAGHKNLLSAMILMLLPFAAWSGFYSKHKMGKKLYITLAVAGLICILLLRTRSIWLVLGINTLIVVVYSLSQKWAAGKKISLGAGIAVGIIALFAYTNWGDSGDTTNFSHRWEFWKKSYSMLEKHPQGVGAGMWKIHLPAEGLQGVNYVVEQGSTQLVRPHNDYLWILTESGYLGFICFMAFVLLTGFYGIKKLIRQKGSSEGHFTFALLLGWLTYLFFSIFDFPMERPEIHLLFFAFSAALFQDGHALTLNKKMRFGLLFIVLIVFGISTEAARNRLSGDKNLPAVMIANANKDARRIIPAVNNCMNDWFNMDKVANSLYYYRGLGHFAQKQLPQAEENFKIGLELTPYNIPTLNQMGNFYAKTGKVEEAKSYYERALHISPHFTAALLNMAELAIKERDYESSFNYLTKVPNPDKDDPKYVKMTSITLDMWLHLDTARTVRPALWQYFQENDPEFKQPVETYNRRRFGN